MVKNLPAMQETQETRDRSLGRGREDPLEKETATHSSILAWEIPWTEEPGGLQSKGPQESNMTWRVNHDHHISAVTAAKWIPFRLFQRCWLS